MKYLVTGCGQSGTTYVAELLTAAGLDCGHEQVFNRWTPGFDTCPSIPDEGECPAGDSSFAAAPFLDRVPDGVTVVHLVRSPLDVIRSVVGRRQMDQPRAWPWVRFVDHHTGILEIGPGARRAAAYWVRWNRLVEERADFQWHTDLITDADLIDLAHKAQMPLDPDAALEVLRSTPRDIGAGPRAEIGLYQLGDMAETVAAEAERYGLPLEMRESG